ncbi:MAG: IS1634 family transposase [Propionibacteriaceae bacterium]|nr:IS1634 family transposase [Propionibacteriaceae bacterium]
MVWVQLGFAEVLPAREKVFPLLALARVVEPTSKRQTIRVLSELGVAAPSYDAITDCVWRCWERGYRAGIEQALAQVARVGSMSFCLYDVTTLHWETDVPDELRKSGFSKQRRLEPQIVLGLLTGSDGFPLLIREFEGNKAETKTIIPVLDEFRAVNPQTRVTVIADAGMLSEANLAALETAGYDFIVGGRIGAEPPGIVQLWQIEHPGEAIADQQIFRIEDHGTKKNPHHWVQWFQYRHKRAVRELRGIDKSVEKARKMATGEQPVKRSRFVTDDGTGQWRLNEELVASARDRAGIRSYKTNLVNASADQIIGWYHQLWHVEHTFRMAKSDLKARPAFHHRAERIHAHLTIVLAGLAVAKRIEQLTGMSILAFIHELKPIRHIKIDLGDGLTIQADNDLTNKAKEALTAIQQNNMWD